MVNASFYFLIYLYILIFLNVFIDSLFKFLLGIFNFWLYSLITFLIFMYIYLFLISVFFVWYCIDLDVLDFYEHPDLSVLFINNF